MDYYWMKRNRAVMNTEGRSAYTKAQEHHQPPASYGVLEYLAYVYYIPFFMTGPVVTFNAFIAQVLTSFMSHKIERHYVGEESAAYV
jgi:D-alanyl-lipoteichoic acid acyltransferase DltB (MBOAT superfamily)